VRAVDVTTILRDETGAAVTETDRQRPDAIAAELNGRPRQTLGWKTPSQVLDQALR
jgi:IS30 family transposase